MLRARLQRKRRLALMAADDEIVAVDGVEHAAVRVWTHVLGDRPADDARLARGRLEDFPDGRLLGVIGAKQRRALLATRPSCWVNRRRRHRLKRTMSEAAMRDEARSRRAQALRVQRR
jgi:hypothetical protein